MSCYQQDTHLNLRGRTYTQVGDCVCEYIYIYLVYIWTTDRLDTEGGCTQPPPDNRLCSQHRFRWASISDLFVPLAENFLYELLEFSNFSPARARDPVLLSQFPSPYCTRPLAPDPLERSTLRSSLYPHVSFGTQRTQQLAACSSSSGTRTGVPQLAILASVLTDSYLLVVCYVSFRCFFCSA